MSCKCNSSSPCGDGDTCQKSCRTIREIPGLGVGCCPDVPPLNDGIPVTTFCEFDFAIWRSPQTNNLPRLRVLITDADNVVRYESSGEGFYTKSDGPYIYHRLRLDGQKLPKDAHYQVFTFVNDERQPPFLILRACNAGPTGCGCS